MQRSLALFVIFLISVVVVSCAIPRGAHAQFTPPSVQFRGTLPTTIGDCAVWNSTNGQYLSDIGPCPGIAAISVLPAFGFNPVLTGPVLTISFDTGLISGIVKNTTGTGTASIATDCVDTYSTACFSGLMALQPANNVAITGGTITGMPSPTVSSDVATKGYVDSTELALNPAAGVQAATTTVLPGSPVYNNGFSGVGATLIPPGNGALIVDGYTVATTDRVLVKNQASALENGIYTVTSAGSAGTRYTLVRAVNFDTIYNINAAGLSPVYHGTANTGTSWAITSTVATVGTDPITWTQYAQFPATPCPAATSGSAGCVQPDNTTISVAAGVISGIAQKTPLTTGTSVSLAAPRQYYVCTSTCTVTPPVPVAGYEFCIVNGNNVSTVITLAALGSSAMYENTARTAYGTAGTGTLVSGAAVANKVCIVGLDATHYLTTTYTGTWTAS